jgi:hypothetical protein
MGIKYENLNTEGLAKQISSKIRDAILEGSLTLRSASAFLVQLFVRLLSAWPHRI